MRYPTAAMTDARTPAAVSIGMPIYNGARSMRRTLDALLAQTCVDFEVLISDNASTDDTEAIGREYAARDPRVRYVRQPTNLGPIGNFLYVFEHARGPYFSWLACDDFYENPTHLQRLRACLDAGDALAFPNINIFDLHRDGAVSPVRRGVFDYFREIHSRVGLSHALVRGASYQLYGMFRRDVIERHLSYLVDDAGWVCFNEGRFLHRVFAHERCRFVADESLNVCVHSANVSRNARVVPLLRDYVRYTSLLPRIYLDADYTPSEKLSVLAAVGRRHTPYLSYLAARSVPAVAADAWSWITSRTRRPEST